MFGLILMVRPADNLRSDGCRNRCCAGPGDGRCDEAAVGADGAAVGAGAVFEDDGADNARGMSGEDERLLIGDAMESCLADSVNDDGKR